MKSLNRLLNRETLLGRTAIALAFAFIVFALITAALLQYTLVRPHTRQAADDLASFLVLAAQIWVELPPFTRPDYEREMFARHDLQIRLSEGAQPQQPAAHAYVRYLEQALSAHLQDEIHVHLYTDRPGWLWADLPMGGRVLRLGFRESRLQNRLLLVLPAVTALGLGAALVLAILLVGRVTRPLADMVEAAHRIGEGDFSARVPEQGPRELAELAHKLNRMEERIGQLVENRTTLLAGISHDLRTPLARMRLELELLRGTDNADLISDMNNDLTEMEQLISRTLQLARGLAREPLSETDIANLLREITDRYQQSGNQVEASMPATCIREVQQGALRQVLINLIDNAVRHGGNKPVLVELLCDPADGSLRVWVIDQGPGIPADKREDIFEPFHRLEASRSRSTGGSGLGLAIVRQLCHAYGWQIEVNARDNLPGASFCLTLPSASVSAPVAD